MACTPGKYIRLDRKWKTGDTIEIQFDMNLRSESMPDNPDRIALLHGPLVLAGDFGDKLPEPWIPVLMAANPNVSDWLKPVPGKANTFRTAGVGRPEDVTFVPFYSLHHRYYSVYFDRFTDAQWNRRKEEYERQIEEKRRLDAITIEWFQPGEMQPERDHNLDGHNIRNGRHNGRAWRDAFEGGWFAFDMKVLPDVPVDLVCTFWGSDSGARTFDILVDGTLLRTQRLNNNKTNEFYDETIPLQADLTKDKDRNRIKFSPIRKTWPAVFSAAEPSVAVQTRKRCRTRRRQHDRQQQNIKVIKCSQ